MAVQKKKKSCYIITVFILLGIVLAVVYYLPQTKNQIEEESVTLKVLDLPIVSLYKVDILVPLEGSLLFSTKLKNSIVPITPYWLDLKTDEVERADGYTPEKALQEVEEGVVPIAEVVAGKYQNGRIFL